MHTKEYGTVFCNKIAKILHLQRPKSPPHFAPFHNKLDLCFVSVVSRSFADASYHSLPISHLCLPLPPPNLSISRSFRLSLSVSHITPTKAAGWRRQRRWTCTRPRICQSLLLPGLSLCTWWCFCCCCTWLSKSANRCARSRRRSHGAHQGIMETWRSQMPPIQGDPRQRRPHRVSF